MDAVDQAALVKNGEVTPLELLDAAIERIERIDPVLNAVVIRWFDHARDTARADLALAKGLSTHDGALLSQRVAADLELPFTEPADMLA